MSLPIPLLVQLLECIQLVHKKVSFYYYVIIALYILFFKLSRDPQILFIFQFSKLLSSQYACPRPISNSLYQYSILYISQYTRSLIQFLFLLCDNSSSKFFYGFFQFASYRQVLKVFLLLNFGINVLIQLLSLAYNFFGSPYLFLEILVLQDS